MGIYLAGLELDHPIINAAGFAKTVEEVKLLAKTPLAAIVLGSITKDLRFGNTGTVVYAGDGFFINSLGLPNPGAEYYHKNLRMMAQMAHDSGKPLLVSVAGFSPREYAELATLVLECGADGAILNYGCPNVWDTGTQKRIVSFYPDLVAENLQAVMAAVGAESRVGIKVSPIGDPYLLEQIASLVGESQLVKFVVACNTFPNGFALNDQGQRSIDPAGGLGGVSGQLMKPIVMGQIVQWRSHLPQRVQIIAAGGIESGADVNDYMDMLIGASAVKIGAVLHREGLRIVERIVEQYVELVDF